MYTTRLSIDGICLKRGSAYRGGAAYRGGSDCPMVLQEDRPPCIQTNSFVGGNYLLYTIIERNISDVRFNLTSCGLNLVSHKIVFLQIGKRELLETWL